MTVKEAEELCKLTHRGQWRNPRKMTFNEVREFYVGPIRIGICLKSGAMVDKGGREFKYDYIVKDPYHTHPFAVAEMMKTDEERILALLHDVIEDTEATLTSSTDNECHIKYEGVLYPINAMLGEGLEILTREESTTYGDYIDRVALDRGLAKIKIADITHNLSTEPKESMKKRYLKAMKTLLAVI